MVRESSGHRFKDGLSGKDRQLRVERVEVNGKEVIKEVVEHRGASVIVPVREDGGLCW
jgi:ADP-ribose pyrophosphatase